MRTCREKVLRDHSSLRKGWLLMLQEARKHQRATTTQKCVRTNDIENVGVTVSLERCLLLAASRAAKWVKRHRGGTAR